MTPGAAKLQVALALANSPELPGAPWEWYYCSFAGPQFLGGCYVRAPIAAAAPIRARILGINPGGAVRIVGPIPTATLDGIVSPSDRERLLTKEEVER